MLVECGFVRAADSEGREWSFTPSLGRIAALADPREIVAIFGRLLGHAPATAAGLPAPDPAVDAAAVLAALCDQEDATPLIGHVEQAPDGRGLQHVPGAMPRAELLIIARHLMQHGIAGESKPGKAGASEGRYSDRFNAAEFITAARVHLGLSGEEAEALSMTELQRMLAMKFPDAAAERQRNVPTREEYDALMARLKQRKGAGGG